MQDYKSVDSDLITPVNSNIRNARVTDLVQGLASTKKDTTHQKNQICIDKSEKEGSNVLPEGTDESFTVEYRLSKRA